MTSITESESTFSKVVRLLRWHKPSGRLILMIPALWALALAARSQGQLPPLDLLVVIIVGSLATSAAGCVVNDLWDRDIDIQVERTKTRPLAAKSLSIKVGIVVLAIATLCAFGLATYLNPLSFGLCFAAVPVIAIYPACKRVFPVPQLVLAIAWGFAVLIPWSALRGALDWHTWALWGATVAWTMGFDTVYAMSDRADDLRVGIKSSAIFFGDYVVGAIATFFAITTGLLLWLGWDMQLGYGYLISGAIALSVWLWQCMQLWQPEPPTSIYQRIFGQNVLIGFIVLAGMLSAAIDK
jgi:4-hydroxybenzoate polyprenyltransferase